MKLNEYQERAMMTCMPTSDNFSYMMLNLVGEVGEFASKVAKLVRKGEAYIGQEIQGNIDYKHDSDIHIDPVATCSEEYFDKYNQIKTELKKEAGDILWQLSGLCKVMNWKLEDVAQMNLDKLASRQQRGVIDGNGDNR